MLVRTFETIPENLIEQLDKKMFISVGGVYDDKWIYLVGKVG